MDTDKKSGSNLSRPTGSAGTLKLRALQRDGSMTEVFLVDGLTIGRTSANTIQAVDDGSGVVERSHARVHVGRGETAVLRCLQSHARVEAVLGPVSALDLIDGTTFRIGETEFSVVAGVEAGLAIPTADGPVCPYCSEGMGADGGDAVSACARCGRPVVQVPSAGEDRVEMVLPGRFHDIHGLEFAVDRFVARGGMGYVLKAHAPNGTPVAVKVLASDANAAVQSVSRFTQEIDLLRSLRHPNVLRLISHGEEAGRVFCVTEWVDGADLRFCLPSRDRPTAPVDYAVARGWLEQACHGLAAIHAEGAVHRDIKPSNLLLRNDGALLVADLGVAKRLDECETNLTSTGQMPGTYWYMAPEQREAPHLVDRRTDIYSLGFTFWEILSGRKPIGGASPPSVVNATVPREMDTLLVKMLSDHIDARPATVLEVLAALPSPLKDVGRPAVASAPIVGEAGIPRNATTGTTLSGGRAPDRIDRLVLWMHDGLRRGEVLVLGVHRHLASWWTEFQRRVQEASVRLKASRRAETRGTRIDAHARAPELLKGSAPPAGETMSGRHSPMPRVVAAGDPGTDTGRTRTLSEGESGVDRSVARATDGAGGRESDPGDARILEQLERELQTAVLHPDGSEERLQALKGVQISVDAMPLPVRRLSGITNLRSRVESEILAAIRTGADRAFAEHRHGAALKGYQEVRRLKAEEAIVTDRIAHLGALRRSGLLQATEAMRRGHLGQAKERIQRLQAEFGDTLADAPECEQLLGRIRLIEARVKETIPALRSSRSLYRLSEVLGELSADRVAIAGLRELREKTAASLATASKKLEAARLHLRRGQVSAARDLIAEVCALVTDHPDAEALEAEACAEEDRRNRLVRQIRTLAGEGRYLRIHRLLSEGGVASAALLGLSNEFLQASSSKRRSDRYLLGVLWLVFAVASLSLAQRLVDWLWMRIADPSGAMTVYGEVVQYGPAGPAVRFGTAVLLASLVCRGGRAMFRGPFGRSVLPDIASLSLCVVAFFVVDTFQRYLVELVSLRGSAGQVEIFTHGGMAVSVALAAVVYSFSIATFARTGAEYVLPEVRLPVGLTVRAGVAMALAGVFVPFGIVEATPSWDFGRAVVIADVASAFFVMWGAACLVLPMNRRAMMSVGGMMMLLFFGVAGFLQGTSEHVVWIVVGGLVLFGGIVGGLRRRNLVSVVFAFGLVAAATWEAWQSTSAGAAPETLAGFVALAAAWITVAKTTEGRVLHGIDVRERSIDTVRWILK